MQKDHNSGLYRYFKNSNLLKFEGNAKTSKILTVSTEAGTAKIVKGMYATALKITKYT